ncbi:hypothetical protein ACHAPT_000821 [Fusarium lateritium]
MRALAPDLLQLYNTTTIYIIDPAAFGNQCQRGLDTSSGPEEFIKFMEMVKERNLFDVIPKVKDMYENRGGLSYLVSLKNLLALAGRLTEYEFLDDDDNDDGRTDDEYEGDDERSSGSDMGLSTDDERSSGNDMGLSTDDEDAADKKPSLPEWLCAVHDLLPQNSPQPDTIEQRTSGEGKRTRTPDNIDDGPQDNKRRCNEEASSSAPASLPKPELPPAKASRRGRFVKKEDLPSLRRSHRLGGVEGQRFV